MAHHHYHHTNHNKIQIAFFLNLAFTVFELVGGLYVNSVAILSDALHDLGDSLALGAAWYFDKKARVKADAKFSFGYRRFSLLGALINSMVLITGSIIIINEAVQRLFEPEHSDAQGMLVFAIIGIIVNGLAAYKLSSGKTLNERVVSWHLLEDVLGWVAVLIVSVVLLFKDIHYLDPALSVIITLYILWNVVRNLKKTLYIFLQSVPDEISVQQIEQKLLKINNVKSIHHTHVWSLDGEHHVFSTHLKLVQINNLKEIQEIKQQAKNILEKYNFEHYTIETEMSDESCNLE